MEYFSVMKATIQDIEETAIERIFTITINRVYKVTLLKNHRIGSVMVGVLPSTVVDHVIEQLWYQTKDYTISTCCYPDKPAALRSKNKDWLCMARNQDNKSQ